MLFPGRKWRRENRKTVRNVGGSGFLRLFYDPAKRPKELFPPVLILPDETIILFSDFLVKKML